MYNVVMMMDNAYYLGLDAEYTMGTYGRLPIAVSHGKNATVYDCDGKKYIDFTAGIGVNSLGLCDEGWCAAVTAQLGRFAHMSNYFVSPATAELGKVLTTAAGMEKVFFCNSGAEANEGAIKLARKYSRDKYGDGKPGNARATVITLKNSFHGRTVTTLAATGQDRFHTDFAPYTEGFKYVEANDLTALREAMTDDVCALMIEAIQGEGGVNFLRGAYLRDAEELCRSRDVAFIIDEVQTGIGRTGRFFTYQNYGIEPDIVTAAKGLGGGLPIGAFMCSERFAGTLGPGSHGSTFGGNPVVCAGALEVVRRVGDPAFLRSVRDKGEYLRSRIIAMRLPMATEIRGLGLMTGVEITGDPHKYMVDCCGEGLLLLTAGTNVLRFLPPLTITYAELDAGLEIFEKVMNGNVRYENDAQPA